MNQQIYEASRYRLGISLNLSFEKKESFEGV